MTDISLQRSILITGVGKPGNLAQALLEASASQGYAIYAAGRKLSDVEAALSKIRQGGTAAHAFAAELTDEEEVKRLAREVAELTHGKLDVLVHAAGKFVPFGPVVAASLEDWKQAYADNATSAFLITREILPMLRNTHGTIIYIASAVAVDQGNVSPATMSNYAAAKAAVVQLMRAVADEERGTVRANAIAPGGIKTAAMLAAVGDIPGLVTPEEVAARIMHLAEADTDDATGKVFGI